MRELQFSQIDDPLDHATVADLSAARREWVSTALQSQRRTDPLRVLIASNSLGTGGAEHQIMRIMPYLNQFGLDVEHLYYSGVHDLRPKFDKRGLRTRFIDRESMGRLAFFRHCLALMRQGAYDVVHAFTGTTNFYVRAPAAFARVPVILGGWRNRPMRLYERLIYGILNVATVGWIINSRSNAEPFLTMPLAGRQRIYVVPNALDVHADLPAEPLDHCTMAWINGRKVVATVGALALRKNHDMFIDVAARISRIRNDAAFLVVGGLDANEKELEGRLRRRVQDENLGGAIRFLGRSQNVPGLLPNVDVVLCTSPYEGCPNAVLEAMRGRRPIIMTNCTDTEKLIDPGVSGYVVGLDDVEGMVERTNELLDDPDKRAAFGDAARKLVERHFEASGNAWIMALIYVNEWLGRNARTRKFRTGSQTPPGAVQAYQ